MVTGVNSGARWRAASWLRRRCPGISVRKFAIPELIEDGVNGLLVDNALDVATFAEAMNWMIEEERYYLRMREQAWLRARGAHSKQSFEKRMQAMLQKAPGESQVQSPENPPATAL